MHDTNCELCILFCRKGQCFRKSNQWYTLKMIKKKKSLVEMLLKKKREITRHLRTATIPKLEESKDCGCLVHLRASKALLIRTWLITHLNISPHSLNGRGWRLLSQNKNTFFHLQKPEG